MFLSVMGKCARVKGQRHALSPGYKRQGQYTAQHWQIYIFRCKHNRPASNKAFDLFCIKKRYDLQYYFYKKSQHTA